jgi:demethylmenaquinone methyltransferase/2-methoxy-6-polyprenyl-1,4-benzoquinol methylase
MTVGQQQINQSNISWSAANAARLPFPQDTFDAAVSGFLVRNLADLSAGLKDQLRVLKPGGRIVILDTTRTPDSILTPLIRIHLHHIIPTLGAVLTGERDAYTYLPETTENFLRPEEITAHLAAAGFRNINFRRFMFGMIAVLWGEK